jgi:hypothetical protein
MLIDTLGLIVTMAGLIFFGVTLLIYVFGEKVRGQPGGRERIRVGDYIEVNTTPVLTLVLISFSLALAPLVLAHLKPPKFDTSLIVHGNVTFHDPGGVKPGAGVQMKIRRGDTSQGDPSWTTETDNQGGFYLELRDARPKEVYWITWERQGYVPFKQRIGYNEIPFTVILELDRGQPS